MITGDKRLGVTVLSVVARGGGVIQVSDRQEEGHSLVQSTLLLDNEQCQVHLLTSLLRTLNTGHLPLQLHPHTKYTVHGQNVFLHQLLMTLQARDIFQHRLHMMLVGPLAFQLQLLMMTQLSGSTCHECTIFIPSESRRERAHVLPRVLLVYLNCPFLSLEEINDKENNELSMKEKI